LALATTTALWTAVWGFIKSVADVVWSAVTTVASGIVAVWTWAMDLLGVKTAQTGSAIGNVFQTLVEWGQWLQRGITLALNVAGYAITHWRDLVQMAAVNVLLSLARLGNQIEYLFTQVIPAHLLWLANNWLNIFIDMARGTDAVLTNMGKNLTSFIAAVWNMLQGGEFDFQWTGLLEGFESTLTELPRILDRQMGPVEAGLQREADRLGESFSKGLGQYLAEQDAAAQGLAEGMKGAGSALADALTPKIDVPGGGAGGPFGGYAKSLDGVTAAATKAKSALGAVLAGSAQGQLLRFQAGMQFADKSPAAAALPGGAKKDMREGDKQASLLKQMIETMKAGNGKIVSTLENAGGQELAVVAL
jgi:hypothetical protein